MDPFYGNEYIAKLSAQFITHLFACLPYPPQSTHLHAKLPHFIAYAIHRTKLHSAVTYAALVLLQRVKARFPTARGSCGHRLFISAFMIASKVICDDTYSNKSWSIVAQGMFTLREINQMEREMCNYLDWELTVDSPVLRDFADMVQRDFAPNSEGPYPTYSPRMVSKRAAKAGASTFTTPIPEPSFTTNPIPVFGQRCQATPTQTHLTPPSPIVLHPALHKNSASPMTPDTSTHSYSNTTSPALSISPSMPAGPATMVSDRLRRRTVPDGGQRRASEAPGGEARSQPADNRGDEQGPGGGGGGQSRSEITTLNQHISGGTGGAGGWVRLLGFGGGGGYAEAPTINYSIGTIERFFAASPSVADPLLMEIRNLLRMVVFLARPQC
ncbi:hypothetical protein C8F04DRAFT_1070143 [Mycena alexandri]|uniref:Cyclin-like domain-containing protein n=1 Tax=Mycena alexandri TaxID=1745969 RepID=A0AAD6TFQ0_9AGAR|nr:hypothetical protein C8F04DRAFT_1070143 [Mycena alexandri]